LLFQRSEQEMMETREDPAFQKDGSGDDGERSSLATPIKSRQAASNLDPNDPSTWGRVARNAPCPCGSGKKYKHCHGKV